MDKLFGAVLELVEFALAVWCFVEITKSMM